MSIVWGAFWPYSTFLGWKGERLFKFEVRKKQNFIFIPSVKGGYVLNFRSLAQKLWLVAPGHTAITEDSKGKTSVNAEYIARYWLVNSTALLNSTGWWFVMVCIGYRLVEMYRLVYGAGSWKSTGFPLSISADMRHTEDRNRGNLGETEISHRARYWSVYSTGL